MSVRQQKLKAREKKLRKKWDCWIRIEEEDGEFLVRFGDSLLYCVASANTREEAEQLGSDFVDELIQIEMYN